MPTIKNNLFFLRNKINELETKYSRTPGSVKLLAVSKNQSVAKIKEAIACGQTVFGESYWQEASSKIDALKEEKIEWHFIGSIQRNKTKHIAENFNWVQSVDNILIAKRLSEQRSNTLGHLNICLQVNIGEEKTKSGILPEELLVTAKQCAGLPRITLRGLMSIPKPTSDFFEQRKQFHLLKELYDSLCNNGFSLDTLSMGMSDDIEASIAEGSTLVRIGTAIFGERA